MNTELKPCPFCGTANVMETPLDTSPIKKAICRTCGARGPNATTCAGSDAAWNTRSSPWQGINPEGGQCAAPAENGIYWVTSQFAHFHPETQQRWYDQGEWRDMTGMRISARETILAWQPLPEPYQP